MEIIRLTSRGYAVRELHRQLTAAIKSGRDVSLSLETNSIKVKVGEGMWTADLLTFYKVGAE